MTTRKFIATCKQSIHDHDQETLFNAVGDFAEFCYAEPTDVIADDMVVDFIASSISSPEFREMMGSWRLLLLIEYNWSTFKKHQLTKFLRMFQLYYSLFIDPMAWFTISEILGEYYCDSEALKVLKVLSTSEEEGPRSLIPHAFEHIVKSAADHSVSSMALHELMAMRNDQSYQVIQEVSISIERLKAVGKL